MIQINTEGFPTRVCLHIGLQKTGTTFLQNAVFNNLDSTNVLRGWSSLRDVMDNAKDNLLLISDERISGRPFLGNWIQQFERNIRLVHSVFNNPRIIIGFRRHSSFLLSLYKQYLQTGGTEDIDRFFDPRSDRGLIKREDLYFGRRLRFIEQRFDRIFVYTQEGLRDSLDLFLQELESFLEVPLRDLQLDVNTERNVGLQGRFQARVLQKLNRVNKKLEDIVWLPTLNNRVLNFLGLTPRKLCQRRLASFPSEALELSEEVRNYLDEFYRDDWEYVQSRCLHADRS